MCTKFDNVSEEVKQDELERRWGRLTESYVAFVMEEKSEVGEDFKYSGKPVSKYENEIENKSITDQSVANPAEGTVFRQSRSVLRLQCQFSRVVILNGRNLWTCLHH